MIIQKKDDGFAVYTIGGGHEALIIKEDRYLSSYVDSLDDKALQGEMKDLEENFDDCIKQIQDEICRLQEIRHDPMQSYIEGWSLVALHNMQSRVDDMKPLLRDLVRTFVALSYVKQEKKEEK